MLPVAGKVCIFIARKSPSLGKNYELWSALIMLCCVLWFLFVECSVREIIDKQHMEDNLKSKCLLLSLEIQSHIAMCVHLLGYL